ncbi:MAG: GntR family transcriptional regulator [Devosia sp.]|uniref:GntR family transcriptional regulator n=1 Tax=Devosia sp. TaxID=1871048 RepID=UPI002627050F|nr:GntR family transcriptional regulator [Devosia sp.]MDB5531307.1 GntR family transcriptional regulator [Devosia sp.]
MLEAGQQLVDASQGETHIPRQNLHSEVLALLRTAIMEGRFKPKERLNERLLCERFGISRTPLREAFKVLAAEGLLTLLPNRGVVVTTLSIADFEATLSVMAHLETMIGEQAAINSDEQTITKIRAWHHQMFAHFLRQEMAPYFELNQKIHIGLAAATGNAVLVSLYASLNAKILRYRYQANLQPERWQAAVEEHEDILSALILRDAPRLGALLRQHLLNKGAAIKSSLEEG